MALEKLIVGRDVTRNGYRGSEDPFVLLTGTSNPDLADKVGGLLKSSGIIKCEVQHPVGKFADGETSIEIETDIRGREVFIIQSTCPPDVSKAYMEVYLMIDAAMRASADSITVLYSYNGYSRQDRKAKGRTPISSAFVLGATQYAGASKIVTVDLHSEQQEGFVHIPFDKLSASRVLVPELQELKLLETVIVSPDAGGLPRAQKYSNLLPARNNLAFFGKRRKPDVSDEIEEMYLVGNIEGMNAIIADDILSTGGTLVESTKLLLKNGAKSVRAVITHGVFAGSALSRINDSPIEEIFITDSIPPRDEVLASKKIHIVSIAPLLAEAIRRLHNREPISPLIP